MFVVLSIVFALVLIAFLAIVYANDLSLPEIDFAQYKQPNKPLTVLALFPHPDDETMAIGGTLAKLVAQRARVIAVDFTHGEAGETNGLCAQSELARLRSTEFAQAMLFLGVQEHRLLNFADGGMLKQQAEVELSLRSLYQEFAPDVVLTYEPAGVYAHPDHIALSKAVKNTIPQESKLFYVTLAAKQLKHFELPSSIKLFGEIINLERQTPLAPTHKSSFWRYRGSKYKAITAHRSQSLAKHLPLPLSLFCSVIGVEYVVEV